MSYVFDTLQYSKRALLAGYTEKQAEFQAEELSILLKDSIVTKTDLKNEFLLSERRMHIFLYKLAAGMVTSIFTILGGIVTLKQFFY
jgi:hypothetical protein